MRLFFGIFFVSMLASFSCFAQITLTLNSSMNFGSLMFDATHSGSVTLGTNGSVGVSGTGLAHSGGGYAGNVSIEGSGEVVEIKCETSGQLSLQNNKIDISATEIVIDTGVSSGNGLACAGTKRNSPVVTTVDLSSNPTPEILMGATLTIDSNSLDSGQYNTSGGGGAKPITINVVVQ